MEDAAQEKYGHYEVIEPIADGAMGSIYLARDPESGGLVAIKTLRMGAKSDGSSAGDWDSLLREAQVAKLLSHPNIVTVHEIVAAQGESPPFVVMEYIQGTNLAAFLTAGMPLPLDFALSVTSQVSDALDHAHLKGVVHGDVKPENILIADDETARLIDFGIAALTGDGNENPDHPAMGTPRYAAPEQAQGKEIGRRADVFSLGVVAFEMLTGQPAFSGENAAEVTWKVARGMMDRLPSEIDELSPQVQCVLAQALHVDPAGRFSTAGDFASALLGAADPVAQEQPSPEPRPDNTASQDLDQVSTQDLSELAAEVLPPEPELESEPDSEILNPTGDEVLSVPELDSRSVPAVPDSPETQDESGQFPENGVFGTQDETAGWRRMLAQLRASLDGHDLDLDWRRIALIAGTTLALTLLLGLSTIWLAQPGDLANLGFSAEHRLRQRIVPLLKEGHRLLLEGEPAIAARVFGRAEDIAPHLEGIGDLKRRAERFVLLQEQQQLDEEEFAALFEEGTRALRSGRFTKATQVAQRLLEIDPESPDALELVHRIKTSRDEARRRSQVAERQRAAEPEPLPTPESSPSAVAPIRAAAVVPKEAPEPEPRSQASRPDWSKLKVDLFSYLPKGVVTVYADDDQILLQPFRFTEKGRLFLKKGTAGRLEAEQRLSAGDTEFRIYVSSEGKETQIVNLPVSLLGGETHVLRIIVAENGSTSAQLD